MSAVDPADAVREAAFGCTEAVVKQDEAGLQRWLADDLQNKAGYIAAVTKGPARYESFDFTDTQIRFCGKAAVLTSYVDVKMVKTDSFRVRTLQVYVENNGRWQMAAHQSARVAN